MGMASGGFDMSMLDGLPVNGFDFPSWEVSSELGLFSFIEADALRSCISKRSTRIFKTTDCEKHLYQRSFTIFLWQILR